MDFLGVTWRLITRDGAHYFIYTFFAAFCVLQMAAAYAGLRGLWLLPRRLWVYLGAGLGLFADFWWFFHFDDRNLPSIAGSEQFLIFVVSGLSALAVVLVFSSWFRAGDLKDNPRPNPAQGLDILREHTYWQAVRGWDEDVPS